MYSRDPEHSHLCLCTWPWRLACSEKQGLAADSAVAADWLGYQSVWGLNCMDRTGEFTLPVAVIEASMPLGPNCSETV